VHGNGGNVPPLPLSMQPLPRPEADIAGNNAGIMFAP